MARKPKLTKKDQYMLFLGILLAFLVQVSYDIAHEVIFYEVNYAWLGAQVVFLLIVGILSYWVLGKVEQE
jgi:hypothetical protein